MSHIDSALTPARKIKLFGKEFAATDIVFAVSFFALFGWFMYVVRFGVNAADEGLYFNIAQRVLQGDRLLVDEWQVSQFSAFLLLLPYRLFTALTGGTEGIILFERRFYVFVTMALYVFLYKKYRRFGFSGLLGVFLVCSFVPGDMFALFYRSMSLQGLIVLCTIFFLPQEKPHSAFKWVFAGIVLGCTVLAEPVLSVLYFLYCAVVLFFRLSKKRECRVPAFEAKAWGLVTAGVILTAIPVIIYFVAKSGVGNIIRIFPELLSDVEYDFAGEHLFNVFWKFLILCNYFGYFNSAVWGVLLAASAALFFVKTEKQEPLPAAKGKKKAQKTSSRALTVLRLKRAVFIAACLCLAASYIWGIVSFVKYKTDRESHQLYMYYFFHSLPCVAFTAVCGLLLKKREPAYVAYWWVILIADVLVSYGSQVSSSVCGVLLFPLMFYSTGRVFNELKSDSESTPKEGKRGVAVFVRAALAVGLCACLCFESVGFYISRCFLPIERYESGMENEAVDMKLPSGALKGLITNRQIYDLYAEYLSDMDRLKELCSGRIYIMEACPYFYLYVDKPVGTYSSWYVEDDAMERQLRFMRLLPEDRPEYVYIPFFDFVTYKKQSGSDAPSGLKLDWVKKHSDCSVEKGRVGYIVRVNEWTLPEE